METKLLTEAEWRGQFAGLPLDRIMPVLEAHGLIAPELEPSAEQVAVQEIADDWSINLSAMPRVEHALLAALKRGMEMRAPLTRGMVREAVSRHIKCHPASSGCVDHEGIYLALTKEQS